MLIPKASLFGRCRCCYCCLWLTTVAFYELCKFKSAREIRKQKQTWKEERKTCINFSVHFYSESYRISPIPKLSRHSIRTFFIPFFRHEHDRVERSSRSSRRLRSHKNQISFAINVCIVDVKKYKNKEKEKKTIKWENIIMTVCGGAEEGGCQNGRHVWMYMFFSFTSVIINPRFQIQYKMQKQSQW